MATSDNERERAERAVWLRERPAEETRLDLRDMLSAARGARDLAAERSTDPAVRAAQERVRVLEQMISLLSE